VAAGIKLNCFDSLIMKDHSINFAVKKYVVHSMRFPVPLLTCS